MKSLFLSFLLLVLAAPSYGAVLFEDNFDTQPPWNLDGSKNGNGAGYTGGECSYPCATAPSNATSTVQWNATRMVTISPAYPHQAIGSIQGLPSGAAHSGSQAFICYQESSSGFGGDCTLTTILPADHSEIYFRAWVKTQPGWQWDTAGGAVSYGKLFRIEHWDRTGNNFAYFSTGTMSPGFYYQDYYSMTYGVRLNNNYRCSPQSSDYYCGSNPLGDGSTGAPSAMWPGTTGGNTTHPSTPGMWADGNWHRFDFHLKLNSAPGVNDGIQEMWFDQDPTVDTPLFSATNIQWQSANTFDAPRGFNMIGIGGNSNGNFGANLDQWYAVDDVVVSTTPMAVSYVVGGAINGSCGSSAGQTFSTTPASNLCGNGSIPNVSGPLVGEYAWTCTGSGGGSNASCTANYDPGSPPAPLPPAASVGLAGVLRVGSVGWIK